MKKCILIGMIVTAGIGLVGCTPGNNVPGSTAAGSVAGGLIGSQIFHNTFAGVVAGALVGGIIGNQIGQYMDRQDRINMESAIVHTPVNQEATWTSAQRGPNGQRVTYTVKPTRTYYSSNHRRYCREYQTTVTIGGRNQQAFGKACRMPDGQWKIMH